MKETFKDILFRLITPKRALINHTFLLNKIAIVHFTIGLFLSLFFTLLYHFGSLSFSIGSICGLIIGLSCAVKVYLLRIPTNRSILIHLNSIHFIRSHGITRETKVTCCGRKSEFCGWVYGVNTNLGLREPKLIRQEMHISIKGTYLIMKIPSPRISRKILHKNVKLSRDIFEFKRAINLVGAKIILYPKVRSKFSNWSLKMPIGIKLTTANYKQSNNWKSTGYKFYKTYLESKLSLFHCKTKKSTKIYIGLCRLQPKIIYICIPNCPEKEVWLRNLKLASFGLPVNPLMWKVIQPFVSSKKKPSVISTYDHLRYFHFLKYMAKYMPLDWIMNKNRPAKLNIEKVICSPHVLWLNALIARIYWDLVEKSTLKETISAKIHKKIQKLQLPIYIKDMGVDTIDIGYNTPIIRFINRPVLDKDGIWIDINIYYDGGLSVSLATKVDLMRLKEEGRYKKSFLRRHDSYTEEHSDDSPAAEQLKKKHAQIRKSMLKALETYQLSNFKAYHANKSLIGLSTKKSSIANQNNPYSVVQENAEMSSTRSYDKLAAFDSDEMDSIDEPSSDSQIEVRKKRYILRDKCIQICKRKKKEPVPELDENKAFRIINDIGRSKYFQKITNNSLAKKLLTVFASKKMILELNIHSFSGTVVVHIPRPPSDRVWYGFRTDPTINMTTIPKIGERSLNFSKITNWIEKKLKSEINNILVFPNMDDVRVPNDL